MWYMENKSRISALGLTDSLTGLLNRDGFKKEISTAISKNKEFNVVHLNLIKFRGINYLWGYAVGDLVLKTISNRIGEYFGETQYIARFDRDDFSFIITNDATEAMNECKKIISIIQKPIQIEGRVLNVHVSIGICNYPNQAIGVVDLIDKADIALRIAKRSHSRIPVQFSKEMVHREQLFYIYNTKDITMDDIRLQCYTVYQPLLCLKSKKVCSLELLLRHPDKSISDIIKWAEEYGCMNEVFKFTVVNAARMIIKTGLPISVNISPSQIIFDGEWLIDYLSGILSEYKLPMYSLSIEITEAIPIENREQLKEIALKIKRLGVRIYLDDFGSGYSFISALNMGVFDVIKLDRALVSGVHNSLSAQNLVLMALSYADSKGMSVVAEGVEDEDEVRTLHKIGINYVQGYFFSKPLEEVDIVNYIKLHNA